MSILRSSSVVFALTFALGGTLGCGSDDVSNPGGAGASGTAGSGAAGGSSDDGADLTGTFSFDGGPTIACKVSTQDFPATGEYSVLCEEDATDFRYVQVTFKDEASARTAQTLALMKAFAFSPEDHPDADAISLGYTDADGDTLYADDDSTGTGKVVKNGTHYTVTLSAVSVESATTKVSGPVTATIDF